MTLIERIEIARECLVQINKAISFISENNNVEIEPISYICIDDHDFVIKDNYLSVSKNDS